MTRRLAAFLVLAAAVSLAACKRQSHEHPENQEHPEQHEGSRKSFDLKKEYAEAVLRHVREAREAAGSYRVADARLGREWRLELVRIHDDRIADLGGGRYFACADFRDPKSGKTIDLDFYASRRGDAWEVEPALLHKVEGEPRFTYNARNERVPAKS